ncbi:MAG TPA: cyclic pyranopterin monophosphate synthase MoaC [Sandaracinaceae bacterium LLY-WYZ-13_1]|nr:cyclic pyranopterin monophosphate synthase MoaC [Sandaracinaceae bacterium LLY-WYZ-13_1]
MSGDERDEPELTHLDARGRARMVDVGDKDVTVREAVAHASVRMRPATLRALQAGTTKKGDVLATARIAGIQAAKRTPELIPLCHHIALSGVEVRFDPAEGDPARLHVEARARARDRTGVEMEALTAASVAALTVYDMLKAIDRGMVIEQVRLESKSGGRSGDWRR